MSRKDKTIEQQYYTVDNNTDPIIIEEYNQALPQFILRYILPMALTMLAFILIFSFTDLLVYQIPVLFLSRIPAIFLTFTILVVYFTRLKEKKKLVITLNNLYSMSLIFMGIFILIILFNTENYRSGIIAFLMLTVASYFFVKGFYSIIWVYTLPFIFALLYFVVVIRPDERVQDLMNPITSYICIIIMAFISEKGRFREFFYKKSLEREKEITDKLYVETLSQNDELIELNESLIKTRENLEISNNTKNRLFSIIAHDLRGAFNILIGISNLLVAKKEELTRDEMENIFPKLLKTSEDTFKLLENLLEWAMSQAGEISNNPQLYKSVELVTEAVSVMEGIAREKNLEFIITEQEASYVYVDANMFATVMRNLISNAIKFSQPANKIELNTIRQESQTIIEVIDKGVGMPENKLKNLFEIDQKSSTPGTNNEMGTGLGLMLCKDFIEKSDGKISVETELNKGTTIRVALPNKKGSN